MKKAVAVFMVIGFLSAQNTHEEDVKRALLDLNSIVSTVTAGEQLSTANTHGGLPHFQIGVNLALGGWKFSDPSGGSDSISIYLPFPYLSLDLGVFPGLSFTPLITGVGSIDLVGRFSTLSSLTSLSDVITEFPVYWAFGVRVGLLKDHLWSPAVSVGFLTSNFSWLGIASGTSITDSIYVRAKYSSTALSFTVSKNFLLFTPYLGFAILNGTPSGEYHTEGTTTYTEVSGLDGASLTRWVFGSELSIFPLAKGYGEVLLVPDHTFFAFGLKVGF